MTTSRPSRQDMVRTAYRLILEREHGEMDDDIFEVTWAESDGVERRVFAQRLVDQLWEADR